MNTITHFVYSFITSQDLSGRTLYATEYVVKGVEYLDILEGNSHLRWEAEGTEKECLDFVAKQDKDQEVYT